MSEKVLVHGMMKYHCKSCGKSWYMYLEKGLEEGGKNNKPVPFIIKCECGGLAQDVSGIIKFPWSHKIKYIDLPEGASYFKNCKKDYRGTPILKLKK